MIAGKVVFTLELSYVLPGIGTNPCEPVATVGPINKWLVPVDGTPASMSAIEYVIAHADRARTHLHLLNVQPTIMAGDKRGRVRKARCRLAPPPQILFYPTNTAASNYHSDPSAAVG